MYTLADLERLTLEITVSHRMDVIAVLTGPERAAELEELAARRPPGELIPDTEVPLSLTARQAAERSVARDTDAPDTLRALAASTRFVKVLEDLAKNPATPADILADLAHRDEGFTSHIATQNASFALEELEVVGVLGGMMARWGAVLHPRAPRWLIEQAGSDPAWPIRQAAAHSALISPKTLLALATDPDSAVRSAASGNLNLPHEVLHRLATSDPDEGVRAAAAANPAVPEVTLLALANADAQWVRAAVAKSLNMTPLVAGLLVDDPEGWVQEKLAANPSCPPEVLKLLARRERGWKVRHAVAANPATPPEVRHRLATRDRSRDVRNRAVTASGAML